MLGTQEMVISHTAENLLEKLDQIISVWHLEDKNIIFVTDNAGDIKKGNFNSWKIPMAFLWGPCFKFSNLRWL